MHRSKFAGFLAFPVFSFLSLAAAPAQTTQTSIPSSHSERSEAESKDLHFAKLEEPANPAFSSSTQQAAPAQDAAAPAQDAAPAAQDTPPPAPSMEQRAELARQAQARVRARRQQRIAAIEQDTYSHKYEIYGGTGFLRMRPGPSLEKVSVFGFDAGVTRYFTNKLGVTADGRGYYGNAYVGNLHTGINFYEPSVSSYSVSAGPQYRIYMKQKWSVSGIALAGVARDVFYGNSQGLQGTLLGLYPNEWRFSATVGAPIDYNVGPGLSIRVTPNYYLTTWGSQTQNNLGFTGGINYRFGRR